MFTEKVLLLHETLGGVFIHVESRNPLQILFSLDHQVMG